MRVDAPRDSLGVEGRGRLAQQVPDGEHALGEPHVGQLGRGDHVAHRIDAGLAGSQPVVDLDEAPVVHDHAGSDQPRGVAPGPATHGHHDQIHLDLLGGGVGPTAVADGGRTSRRLMPAHGDTRVHVDTTLPERPADRLGHVGVATHEDLRQRFEERHRRTQVGQHRGELATDGATTDHRHPPGHLGDRQQLIARDHQLAIDLEPADRAGRRAGSEDHMVGLHQRRPTIGTALDRDRVVHPETTGAVVDRDIATRQQGPEALDQLVDHPLLALLADDQVHRRLSVTRPHPERRSAPHGSQNGRRLEQFLGRDAAHVQAGSTDAVLLDQAHVEPRSCAVQGSRITGGPPADHHQVMTLRHRYRLTLCSSGPGRLSPPPTPARRTPPGAPGRTAVLRGSAGACSHRGP